jgi:hypothetical protein
MQKSESAISPRSFFDALFYHASTTVENGCASLLKNARAAFRIVVDIAQMQQGRLMFFVMYDDSCIFVLNLINYLMKSEFVRFTLSLSPPTDIP